MLERLLNRLYFSLLSLYPDLFLDEFGEEMSDVFAQALSGLDASAIPPAARTLKMARLFLREVWFFPLAYLDARGYKVKLGASDDPRGSITFGGQHDAETWVGRRTSWGAALLGTLPFLLFGLANLLDGFAELGRHDRLVFNLLAGSLNRPPVRVTLEMGVYLVCALGLLFGVLKGFPRWSYAYLGMSYYFGWSTNNQNYYGLFYKWWVWLPLLIAIILGLLLARSLKPLARLLRGAWNDWTRLSFAIYAFFVPMLTVVFFDDDWGAFQLYVLIFDTVLLAAGAVAFLRSRTIWGRVLSLLAVVLLLVVKSFLGGWGPPSREPLPVLSMGLFFTSIYIGFLLLPAVIGLLRRGVAAFSVR